MTDTIEETVHELSIPDSTGDTRVMWDPRIEDEVKVARKAFNDATKKGMAAFSVTTGGDQGERIREFDPQAGKIIMVKQLAGG